MKCCQSCLDARLSGDRFAQRAGADRRIHVPANCAQCHEAGIGRAPQREAFRDMTPERVLAAMETGEMITMAHAIPAQGRRAIAQFLTGKEFGHALEHRYPRRNAMCSAESNANFNLAAGPSWSGWGGNTSNTRFQDAAMAGLTAGAGAAPQAEMGVRLSRRFELPTGIRLMPAAAFLSAAGRQGLFARCRYGLHPLVSRRRRAGARSAITVAKIETPAGAVYAAFFGDGECQCVGRRMRLPASNCGRQRSTIFPSRE